MNVATHVLMVGPDVLIVLLHGIYVALFVTGLQKSSPSGRILWCPDCLTIIAVVIVDINSLDWGG